MSILLKADILQEERLSPTHRSFCFFAPLALRQGYVFFLAQVEKNMEQSELFFETVQEHLERLAGSFGKETNAQHRFEQFLSALNETCASRVRENVWAFPIHRLSAVVGMASGNVMYLSGTGDPTALFLHKKPSSQYQVYDLSRNIRTEQALPTWEKVFAVVLDGELHPGDAFCLSNQDLRRAMKADDLHTILATLPPTGAIEAIRQHFPLEAPLCLFILQATETDLFGSRSPSAKPRSELSLQQLGHTRKQTDAYLQDQTPHTVSYLWRLFRQWLFPSKTKFSQQLTRFDPFIRFLWRLLLCILRVGIRMTIGCPKDFARHSYRLTKKDIRASTWRSLREQSFDQWFRVKRLFHRLPHTTKYLVLAIVLTCLAFGMGIVWRQHTQALSEAEMTYLSQVSSIQAILDRAESALIYKDEEQARALYTQATEALSALPIETVEEQQARARLQEQVQSGMDTLHHIVYVPDPPILGDLSSLEGAPEALSLLLSGDAVTVLGSDHKWYNLQKTQKTFTVIHQGTPSEISSPVATMIGTTLAFLDTRPGITLITEDMATASSLTFSEDQTVRAIHGYGDRLYLLVKEKGDAVILRSSASGDGVSTPSSWIKTKTTNLGMAVDFAIDGTVYVLLQDGSIVQFVGGNEAAWHLGTVEPIVQNAQAIWTDIDSSYLYILEPSQKRLLIFEKETGAFVVQYVSDLLLESTAFSVSEDTRSIYFLSGSRVYTMAASHL
ncbi:TPA: hypothetical protein DEP34_02405 [Candidatus Uhrbacteria bacterium]|uniref:Uncharacterized protein n=2 Tax=Candidatus Uhriibacteriota TaxID=1752732 RepID=A0A0G1Q8J1_9BACT|nr:MAG: hypothetical protein UX45_C0008G0013 [Candidatus Uhrbacteria bacterium GW2011_GWF2_46_218]KKU41117.1 MAG: hypothetical protein UX57_C0006G0027 [Candidatus Uhrbacteria bacterium GW2011_GWE2_46_68]HBK34298.1 hypothetical protein [Candidatus Uhrbacteria bacterium]HCB19215.1 hypothetical protein [Candidatus Uhrbacteria bacterium]